MTVCIVFHTSQQASKRDGGRPTFTHSSRRGRQVRRDVTNTSHPPDQGSPPSTSAPPAQGRHSASGRRAHTTVTYIYYYPCNRPPTVKPVHCTAQQGYSDDLGHTNTPWLAVPYLRRVGQHGGVVSATARVPGVAHGHQRAAKHGTGSRPVGCQLPTGALRLHVDGGGGRRIHLIVHGCEVFGCTVGAEGHCAIVAVHFTSPCDCAPH